MLLYFVWTSWNQQDSDSDAVAPYSNQNIFSDTCNILQVWEVIQQFKEAENLFKIYHDSK